MLASAALLGIGVGLAFAALGNLIVQAVPPEQTGAAGGMNTVMRTIGGAIGGQLAATFIAGHTACDGLPAVTGFEQTFVMATLFLVARARSPDCSFPTGRRCAPAGRRRQCSLESTVRRLFGAHAPFGCGLRGGSGSRMKSAVRVQLRHPPVRSRRAARISAGTSRARITVASKMIPAARPIANSLISKPGLDESTRNANIRISAALVTSLPVRARPSSIALLGRAGLVVGLAHAREHEDLVVHREAEQEREDHQRDPGRDRLRRRDVPERRAVALLEDEDDDPERGRERERGSGSPP